MTDFDVLAEELRDFVKARDWGQFHNPKNLVMALTGEVGELAATMQWMSAEEAEVCSSGNAADAIKDEIADVFIYLMLLADRLDLDLLSLAHEKLTRNHARYPSHLVKGRSAKYDTYQKEL